MPLPDRSPVHARSHADAELAELADRYGVATGYTTDRGRPMSVSPDTLRAVLGAFGVDATTPADVREALDAHRSRADGRLLPPSVVVRARRVPIDRPWPTPAGAELWVDLEDGSSRHLPSPGEDGRWPGGLAQLPVGRHTLHAAHAGRTAAVPLLVAPTRLATPQRRGWGLLTQLYSMLSERSWGMGDLGDLTELATWSGRLGADFLQLNPLHAYVPGPLPDPSPYRPSSRRFPDPMNLRVEAIPEYAGLDPAASARMSELSYGASELRQGVLRRDAHIERTEVWALKREALELVHLVPRTVHRQEAYRAYLAREGTGLTDFATWCALAEVHGTNWRSWPTELRSPDAAGVTRARRDLARRVGFYRWLGWAMDDQLAAAQDAAVESGMAIGMVHDLAVGVDPEGADAWSLQRYLATGITVGCPADDFNPHGQDWGLPPWRPDTLAEAGYEPFAEVLRGVLRRSGALRLDHIMGLFRLWWVPEGCKASEGTYVRYDHEALLGVLALEAHRAGSMVIGEDLGTVEPGVRKELEDRGILGTSVLRFEFLGGSEHRAGPLPPDQWREQCLATLTTHDLPSTAAWLTGEHVRLHDRLGLLGGPVAEAESSAAAERDGWLAELSRTGVLRPAVETVSELSPEVLALHRFLALTPARMLGVWLPDLVGDRRPQNVPGTVDQYPNWRLPVADPDGRPVGLEELAASPGARLIAELFTGLASGDRSSTENPAGAE